MKNSDKLEAKKNMMIGMKIQSVRCERGSETGTVCVCVCGGEAKWDAAD